MPAISDTPIAKKLQIKPGRIVLLVNAPKGYATRLGKLPNDVKVLKSPSKPADVIQVFVASRRELEAQLPKLKAKLNAGGALWVTYYKGTAKVKTDINRDSVNAYAHTLGLEGVAIISIDDDWAALRLKAVNG
jgi:hypothetical protein